MADDAGTARVVLALPSWDGYLRTGLDDLFESAPLATADVPMTANSATATADGMVVTLVGELVEGHVAAEDAVE